MNMEEALKLAIEAMEITGGFDVEINAIKEALAQPEQEPVAWPVGWVDDGGTVFWKDKPPADGADLYTSPPQRTWVGLTDEDCKGMSAGDKAVAMWADRTLKEKNT